MDNRVEKIINILKKNLEKDIEELFFITKDYFSKEIKDKIYSEVDINFLIDLVRENQLLNNKILKDIFLNSKEKENYKIVVTKRLDNIDDFEENNIYSRIFRFISSIGTIYIIPKKILFLFNDMNSNNKKLDDTTSFIKINKDNILDSNKENSKNLESEIIIKYINYDNFTSKYLLKDKNYTFDNYMRKFKIKKFDDGIEERFQLKINLENNNNLYVSIFQNYKGVFKINIRDKSKVFLYSDKNDINSIIEYF